MQRFSTLIILAIVFSSCSNRPKSDLAVFKATEEGLDQSNKIISISTSGVYHALQKKLSESQTAYYASVWQPPAMLIKEKSDEMVKYLEILINKLKAGASIKGENGPAIFKEDNIDAVSQLFIDMKKGSELYERLQKYKQDMLAVNPAISEQFGKDVIIVTRQFETDSSKQKDFTKTFFSQTPAIAALATLRKFENNVKIMENEFVNYCNNKIPSGGWNLMVTVPLISQSSNYIKGGGEMEVIAGVGA